MATFFGEVVFSSSRAIDDDEEDELFSNDDSEVLYLDLSSSRETSGGSHDFQHVVFTSTPAPNVFADSYILHQEAEAVGMVSLKNKRDESTKQVALLSRLKAHPDVLICKCASSVDNRLQFSFVQQLFTFLGDSKATVTILASCSGSEYKTDRSEISLPILRCLKSSSFSTKPACTFLESPNTVSGLSSAVLSYCQIHHIPAILYVVYTDSIFLDSDAVTAFNPLMTAEPFNRIAKGTSKSEDIMKSSLHRPSNLESLYT